MPPTLPVASTAAPAARVPISKPMGQPPPLEFVAQPQAQAGPPMHSSMVQPPPSLEPVAQPQACSVDGCCPLAPPRTFTEGDCIVANGDIEYLGSQDRELTVSNGSLGTVVSVEPLGVAWRGHETLTNAEVMPEQIAFPEPQEGKILAVRRSTFPPTISCLAAVRIKGAEEKFAASLKPVPCVQDSEEQVFLMMPCGAGNIRPGKGGKTCMELVHPQLTLFRPCASDLVDGQIFQLQMRSKRFQAGVSGFVGCYDLGGANLDELHVLPCNETSTEFNFVSNIAR